MRGLLLLAFVSCGRADTHPLQQGRDGGPPGDRGTITTSGVDCSTLGLPACEDTSGCRPALCAACGGSERYDGCVLEGATHDCAPADCDDCAGYLTQDACAMMPDCTWSHCSCDSGEAGHCTSPRNACPPVACTCAGASERDCLDSPLLCHPIYGEGLDCDCDAPGCCMTFVACGEGATALCEMPATFSCRTTEPACGEGFVASYGDRCYEGCVAASDCDD